MRREEAERIHHDVSDETKGHIHFEVKSGVFERVVEQYGLDESVSGRRQESGQIAYEL